MDYVVSGPSTRSESGSLASDPTVSVLCVLCSPVLSSYNTPLGIPTHHYSGNKERRAGGFPFRIRDSTGKHSSKLSIGILNQFEYIIPRFVRSPRGRGRSRVGRRARYRWNRNFKLYSADASKISQVSPFRIEAPPKHHFGRG